MKRLGLGILFLIAVPSEAHAAPPAPIERAFNCIYDYDFAGARAVVDDYIAREPQDPLGHMVRGATYLFWELGRLRVLESEFFVEDTKIIEDKRLKPDPDIRTKFFASVDQGKRLATARLAVQPDERNALFSMCIASGLVTDYNSLIDKRLWSSVSNARQSQAYAVRLLKVDPTFYDAYLTTGISEYIIGSLPFFLRWFVRFDQVQGSKQLAIQNLTLAARSAHLFKPAAKMLLSTVYLREKRPRESQKLLSELALEFPHNPLFRRELEKLSSRLGNEGSR